MFNEQVAQSLELLREVRVQVHGNVESIVIQQIDECIRLLEEAQDNSSVLPLTSQDVLNILGFALKALPDVVLLLKLVKEFSG
jgi:hypothetical protein